jgi:serine/threonine protein kinase
MGFMAPEVLRGEYDGRAADMFSLGCVLFELFSGIEIGTATIREDECDPIFPADHLSELLDPDGEYEAEESERSVLRSLLTEDAAGTTLLRRLCDRRPRFRPTIEDACRCLDISQS